MNIRLDLPKVTDLRPRLTVIGVGGAGGNAVNNMIGAGLNGVNFVVANTDAQSLANSSTENRIQLGVALTEGLGAGARPEIGEAAAVEAIEEIRAQVAGSHMVFIAAGMGGGTGTGAASVIARVARECGALTVGVVTKPFQFEGSRRMRAAELGIAALKPNVDTMIVIPNQNLFRIANAKTTFAEAFVLADQVLYSGIACIVDLIVKEGLINLDFADVRTVMSGMGAAMMGTGEAAGEGRAVAAAEEAISNPLLDDITLRGAKGLLLSITGGHDLTLYEVDEAASRVRKEVDAEANIIVGATFDDTLGDRIRVSIVASGMEKAADAGAAEAASANGRASAQDSSAFPSPLASMPSQHYGGPPQSFPHAAEQAAATAPASYDAAVDGARGRDDLARALAEAFRGNTAAAAPAVPAGEPAQRQTWTSPGGAVFEEAAPHIGVGTIATPPPQPAPAPTSAEAFSPQAPAEVRRPARRLPEVGDFSDIAQREYRSKAEQYAEQKKGSPSRQPGQPPAPPARSQSPVRLPVEPPRKLGFFERLTGARRRPTESASRDESVRASSYPQADRPAGRSSAGLPSEARGEQDDQARNAPPQHNEATDLPGFFNKGRKSR